MNEDDISAAEIRQYIAEIYAEHPYLENRQSTADCSCCEWMDVEEEYGWDAGRAWAQLDAWKWLLNE